MSLDPNIILAGKPATIPSYYDNQLNQAKLNSANQDSQMNDIKINQYNQSLADKAKLDSIYSGYTGDKNDLTQKLIQSGNIKEGMDIGNFGTEQTTKNLANSQATNKIIGQVAGAVLNTPDEKIHDAASQGIDYLQQAVPNVYTPEFAASAKQHLSTMQPAEARAFLQQLQTQALSPEQQLPKVSIEDLNGSKQPTIQSPITGVATQVGAPMMKTLTPDQTNDNTFKATQLDETKRHNLMTEDKGSETDITLSPEAITNAAARYNVDGTLPTLGMGKKSSLQKANILNQSALLSIGVDPTDLRINQIDNKSKSGALLQNSKDIAAITPYKEMLDKNADIAIELSKKVMMTDSRLANKTLNWVKQNAADNPDTAEYLAQIVFVQTEAARVLNNPRLVGQLSDSARQEMETVINGDMPLNATERVLNRIKKDGDNRVNAMLSMHDTLIKSFKHENPAQQPAKNNTTPVNAYKSNVPPKEFPQAKYLADPQGNMHWYVKGANGKAQIVTQ